MRRWHLCQPIICHSLLQPHRVLRFFELTEFQTPSSEGPCLDVLARGNIHLSAGGQPSPLTIPLLFIFHIAQTWVSRTLVLHCWRKRNQHLLMAMMCMCHGSLVKFCLSSLLFLQRFEEEVCKCSSLAGCPCTKLKQALHDLREPYDSKFCWLEYQGSRLWTRNPTWCMYLWPLTACVQKYWVSNHLQ